jgi:hypothetical protein|uniref:Uncharacterized protein n=1 Tax=viral metagenome TaxID=1070528 RepID=A0A6C0FG04_9ZZZZ|tara:strand:- start:43518 stop:43964 length:447 start_codon:yes stop_codon:yes gene_type:complete
MNLDQKSSLKACLEEEKENPRMKNYVKILDTPNISAFEWIHRVQEELMDGIVYLEKLREILQLNMRELDAARLAAMKETETKSTGTDDENSEEKEDQDSVDEETIEININVPALDEKEPTMFSTKSPETPVNKPKKKKIKVTKPKSES